MVFTLVTARPLPASDTKPARVLLEVKGNPDTSDGCQKAIVPASVGSAVVGLPLGAQVEISGTLKGRGVGWLPMEVEKVTAAK